MTPHPPRPFPDALVELLAQHFRVLGQPVRIRLLDELERQGEVSVQALADHLGSTQQNASRHLGVLADAGLLARRRAGRVVWYRLADDGAFSLLETAALRAIADLSGDADVDV